MSEIHPHDALLERLNEEQFQMRKAYGMWGGCDWVFIDADPEALVIEVVAKDDAHEKAVNIATSVARSYARQFRTGLVRTWSRASGSDEEPLLQEFPFVFDDAPDATRYLSADLWERCAAIGWERGTEALPRPEPRKVHRVVNVVAAPPPLPKRAEDMTPDEIQAWAHEWAVAIMAEIGDQL